LANTIFPTKIDVFPDRINPTESLDSSVPTYIKNEKQNKTIIKTENRTKNKKEQTKNKKQKTREQRKWGHGIPPLESAIPEEDNIFQFRQNKNNDSK
jgi:transcription initiation factor TFIIIB Brf1 subunit/transcription initiation factor TFIIB